VSELYSFHYAFFAQTAYKTHTEDVMSVRPQVTFPILFYRFQWNFIFSCIIKVCVCVGGGYLVFVHIGPVKLLL
jgi:hypothetical protein